VCKAVAATSAIARIPQASRNIARSADDESDAESLASGTEPDKRLRLEQGNPSPLSTARVRSAALRRTPHIRAEQLEIALLNVYPLQPARACGVNAIQ
jgi:hypothetical protein